VPDGVLPALLVSPVVRKQVHDDLIDLAQRAHLLRRVLDRPRYQRDVRIRRLGVRVVAPVRPKPRRPGSVRPGTRRTGTGNGRREAAGAGVKNGVGAGRINFRCGFYATAVEKRLVIETVVL